MYVKDVPHRFILSLNLQASEGDYSEDFNVSLKSPVITNRSPLGLITSNNSKNHGNNGSLAKGASNSRTFMDSVREEEFYDNSDEFKDAYTFSKVIMYFGSLLVFCRDQHLKDTVNVGWTVVVSWQSLTCGVYKVIQVHVAQHPRRNKSQRRWWTMLKV